LLAPVTQHSRGGLQQSPPVQQSAALAAAQQALGGLQQAASAAQQSSAQQGLPGKQQSLPGAQQSCARGAKESAGVAPLLTKRVATRNKLPINFANMVYLQYRMTRVLGGNARITEGGRWCRRSAH